MPNKTIKLAPLFETKSMAQILENQGKFKEAFLIYKKLYEKEKSKDLKEALLRIRDILLKKQQDPQVIKLKKILESIKQFKSHA